MKGHERRPAAPGQVPEQYAEVGTDDKHIPHAVPHIQPETVPDHPPLDPGPPRDYYRGNMAGGVPSVSHSNGKPNQDRWEKAGSMATVIPTLDRLPAKRIPIPVTIVGSDTGTQPLSRIATFQVLVKATGFTPLVGRDLKRTHVTIYNEDASNAVRFAQGGIEAQTGFYVAKASQSPRFACQDTVWAYSPSGSAVYVSLLLEYGIAEGQ
jgi:hypothetical protein